MATNPYTTVSITGYNVSPPPDDGSSGATNVVEWAKHINKIGDPLKTALESLNSNVNSAFTTVASDYLALADIPCFSANKNSVDQVISDNTETKITFTTEVFDTASDYDAGDSSWTPSVAGKYLITASVYLDFSTFTGTANCYVVLYKNGAAYQRGNFFSNDEDGLPQTATGTWIADANGTTDKFELYFLYNSSAGTDDVFGNNPSTHWSGVRVR